MTAATDGDGTAHPSGTPEFTTAFSLSPIHSDSECLESTSAYMAASLHGTQGKKSAYFKTLKKQLE